MLICNPYDIKFNNGYYLLISYIICVNSRLLIGLVFTAIVFLDSKISNINNFQYQYSIFLFNTRRQNEHLNGYHLLVADAVKVFNIVYWKLVSGTNMDDMDTTHVVLRSLGGGLDTKAEDPTPHGSSQLPASCLLVTCARARPTQRPA